MTDDITDDDGDYVLIIDPRTLDRECLSQSLSMYSPAMTIRTAGSIDEWRRQPPRDDPAAILLVFSGTKVSDPATCEKISNAAKAFGGVPVIVIADSDDLGEIMKAVELGARGYIPNSVRVSVAAQAIALARAGGVFIPASSILAAKDAISSAVNGPNCHSDIFTPREMEVAEALRRGKANKIIAYEMNLRESTVKVHIRNIMKKLHATNRTEAAFKLK
ncbi:MULTISPECIES: response regulator transcription factor [Alphaproteobacteria]|uniref:response regulator transcription factor n=1 Tax=Alphaproteobacteria TaxID=28211 RepID=UPI001F317515|nr:MULTISPECIES: response regulator transcription factor [Alphaproteobacteria]